MCPPHKLSEIVAYSVERKLQLIVGCDANAHHTVWGSSNNNTRGESLLQFISSEGLVVANIGNEPTFVTSARREVLDLTLCTDIVSYNIKNWHVSEEPSCSDHRQIRFDLATPSLAEVKHRNPRNTDWEGYIKTLSGSLEGSVPNVREPDGLETAVELINEAVMAAYQENCQERSRKCGGNTPWWNKHLKCLRDKVRRLFNKAKLSQEWDVYRKTLTQYNKEVRRAKRHSWRKFCAEINDVPACSRIHKVLAKDNTVLEVSFLKKENGTYTDTIEESLEMLTKAHFPGSHITSDPWLPLGPTAVRRRPSSEEWKLATEITRPDKIRWATNKFHPFKSPGPDGIYPALIQKGQEVLVPYLTKIFRASLAWGYIPQAWREAKVIYLPKVGRSSDLTPKAYRPISLSSFFLKTLERLIDRYIRDDILRARPLSSRQYAYQPGKSTDSALDDLNRLISKSIEDKEIAMATFLDVEGAFNNVSFTSIIDALQRRGIPHLTGSWIKASLENRIVKSTLGEATIKATVNRGCPQGGVLSPLLWTILVDDLIRKLSAEGFYCLGYADDLAIVVKGKFAGVITEQTQKALNIVNKWCQKEQLSVNAQKTTAVVFTRKKVLGGLKPLTLNNVRIQYSKEAKYLGVIFDQRLTWNPHIQKTTHKSIVALGRCRRMCGKNWGLNPKMTLWLYTRVVRPMIAYGAIVWWNKTRQSGVARQLSCVQRLACLATTGAMRTTPTAAMEVLLNLPPLHIFIQKEARSIRYRLLQGHAPISQQHGSDHLKLYEELRADPLLGMHSDSMIPRYSYEKNFKVQIPGREAWEEGPPVRAELALYTDGSKTEEGVGAGIYEAQSKTKISLSLGKYATVFQAEIIAIEHCAVEILNRGIRKKKVAIYSDSQAALQAIDSCRVDSRLVWDCLEALTSIGQHNKVTLAWVPGHKGIPGNEKADELAREGSSKALVGPEPFCGIAKPITKARINMWMQGKSQEWWTQSPGMRQAKLFIKESFPSFTVDLLSRSRKEVRMVVGLLTGHCRLRKHMSIMTLTEEAECRFCQEEEETPEHILCQCEGLARARFTQLGEEKPSADRYVKEPLSKLINLIKKIGLDKVL